MERPVYISRLKTVKNFAHENKVTTSYIYKLEKEMKIELVEIDGVKFVDTELLPFLITRKNKP